MWTTPSINSANFRLGIFSQSSRNSSRDSRSPGSNRSGFTWTRCVMPDSADCSLALGLSHQTCNEGAACSDHGGWHRRPEVWGIGCPDYDHRAVGQGDDGGYLVLSGPAQVGRAEQHTLGVELGEEAVSGAS